MYLEYEGAGNDILLMVLRYDSLWIRNIFS